MRQPPGGAHQPHGAGDQALRHQHNDGDKNRAEHEIPARDVGADHVLDDDDKCCADDRTQQRGRTAGDHHEQALGGRSERQRLRADELIVVDEQHAGDRAQEPGQHEGPEPDHPDVEAECVHAPRLIARAGKRGAERRIDDDSAARDREQEDDQRRIIETHRRGQRQSKWRRTRIDGDAVVAVGDADPAIGQSPDDLAKRQRNHDETDAAGAQRQRGKARGHYQAGGQSARDGDGVPVACGEQIGDRVSRHSRQPGVPERHQPAIADQNIQAERKHRIEQDLARDVDVVRLGNGVRQRKQRHHRERHCDKPVVHRTCPPNRPCGRSTSTRTIGRNSTK